MRFITELAVSKDRQYPALFVDFRKEKQAEVLGKDILKIFNWSKDSNEIEDHYKLEIEAFPMEKWIEFKQKLFTHVYEEGRQGIAFNQVRILELIKELESFGKSAGAAKQLTNGTE